MIAESPYIVTRSEGLAHIRLRRDPKGCVACVRLDAYEIVHSMAYLEGLRDAAEAAKKAAL